MKVKDVTRLIEELAPLKFQESFDNSGLCVGNPESVVTGALICMDVTEEIVLEAVELKVNLIISHHPVIFSGLKSITGKSAVERIVLKCIKNDIALYSAHTNLDSVLGGVNDKLANVLGLVNTSILTPIKGQLVKVATFVPNNYADKVRNALFDGGAGAIGNYSCCSFNVSGEGTFRATSKANPFVGKVGELHIESEVRIETICSRIDLSKVIQNLIAAHPYEEPAYDIIPLDNELKSVGLGIIGELENPMDTSDFLRMVKSRLGCDVLRYSKPLAKPIRRVAVLGGSGASFISHAIAQNADAFVTADIKYHNFIDAEDRILLLDAGHFETERFTVDIFYDFITKKMVNFAVYKTKHISNPVNYLFH